MYSVQVLTIATPVSTTSTPRPHWHDHSPVGQMATEQAELQEARAVERILSALYHDVRIVKYAPGGDRFEVVR